MSDTQLDLSASPSDIYKAIAAMDEDAFEKLMSDEKSRPKIIDALVEHFSSKFRGDKAEGEEAIIHIKLWDKPGGGYDQRELVIRDGECSVNETAKEEPKLTIKIRPTDLRKLVTGETGAKRLAFKGRLRAIGDIGLGMRLGEMFDFSS